MFCFLRMDFLSHCYSFIHLLLLVLIFSLISFFPLFIYFLSFGLAFFSSFHFSLFRFLFIYLFFFRNYHKGQIVACCCNEVSRCILFRDTQIEGNIDCCNGNSRYNTLIWIDSSRSDRDGYWAWSNNCTIQSRIQSIDSSIDREKCCCIEIGISLWCITDCVIGIGKGQGKWICSGASLIDA